MYNSGFVWMLGTLVCYTTAAIATRELSYQIETPSILLLRSIISILLMAGIVAATGDGFGQVRTQVLKLHVLRNAVHFLGQFGWVYSISFIPLAHVFAIEFTVPLWIAILAPIFLKEKITFRRALIIAIGFAGILVIVQPFGFSFHPASLVMLVGAFGFASAMLVTRKLTNTETPVCILFYMAVLQFPISAALVLASGEFQLPDTLGFALAIFITCAIMMAHYCMARAFKIAEVMLLVPVEYLRLPLIAIAGAVLYEEPITAAVVIGGLMILSANYMNIRMDRR